MNGELAQICALITYGNAYLADPKTATTEIPQMYINALEFRIRTLAIGPIIIEPILARDPAAWWEILRGRGATRLMTTASAPRTDAVPAAIAEGFSNGMQRQIAVGGYPTVWSSVWHTSTTPQRGWSVAYHGRRIARDPQPSSDGIENVTAEFDAALTDALQYAERNDWATAFAPSFTRALDALHGAPPSWTPADLWPENHPGPAARLLRAAGSAWVFGGMGSWNDNVVENADDARAYGVVTERLHGALNAAIRTGADALAT